MAMSRFREKYRSMDVLLIDDVLTTGTTIAQCAQVLHQAGARQISSLTIASGMK